MLIADDVETTLASLSPLLDVFVILVIDHVVAKRPRSLVLVRRSCELVGAGLTFQSIANPVLGADAVHRMLHHVGRNGGQGVGAVVLGNELI